MLRGESLSLPVPREYAYLGDCWNLQWSIGSARVFQIANRSVLSSNEGREMDRTCEHSTCVPDSPGSRQIRGSQGISSRENTGRRSEARTRPGVEWKKQ